MFENKKEKESKKPSKCRFKSICVFDESVTEKDGEFLKAMSELGNALTTRNIHFVYGGGIQSLRGNVTICASIRGSKVLGDE